MPFKIDNLDNIVIFNCESYVNSEDFKQLLVILKKLLIAKKKFSFIVNTIPVISAPLNPKTYIMLASWMKKNKIDIKNTIISSAIVVKNKTIHSLLNLAFKITKPVNPCKITSLLENAIEFVQKYNIDEPFELNNDYEQNESTDEEEEETEDTKNVKWTSTEENNEETDTDQNSIEL